MADTKHRAVIVSVVFLEKKRMLATGRKAFGLLILDAQGQIVARPFIANALKEVVDYVRKHKQDANLGKVTFEPPEGTDATESKYPRRYEAIELSELYYVSNSLRQS